MLHAKFYFGDIDGKAISPYPSPNLSGDWEIVKAFINPLATHTFSVTYKTGRSQTRSATTQHAWDISADVAYGIFSASAKYSGYAKKTDSTTWSTEKTVTNSITVEAGKTVVMWHYVFNIEQYGDEFAFQSNIIGNTDNPNIKPKIWFRFKGKNIDLILHVIVSLDW